MDPEVPGGLRGVAVRCDLRIRSGIAPPVDTHRCETPLQSRSALRCSPRPNPPPKPPHCPTAPAPNRPVAPTIPESNPPSTPTPNPPHRPQSPHPKSPHCPPIPPAVPTSHPPPPASPRGSFLEDVGLFPHQFGVPIWGMPGYFSTSLRSPPFLEDVGPFPHQFGVSVLGIQCCIPTSVGFPHLGTESPSIWGLYLGDSMPFPHQRGVSPFGRCRDVSPPIWGLHLWDSVPYPHQYEIPHLGTVSPPLWDLPLGQCWDIPPPFGIAAFRVHSPNISPTFWGAELGLWGPRCPFPTPPFAFIPHPHLWTISAVLITAGSVLPGDF